MKILNSSEFIPINVENQKKKKYLNQIDKSKNTEKHINTHPEIGPREIHQIMLLKSSEIQSEDEIPIITFSNEKRLFSNAHPKGSNEQTNVNLEYDIINPQN